MVFLTFFPIFLCFLSLSYGSQLEELVDKALKKNPYLKAFEHKEESLLMRGSFLKALPNPELRLTLRNWDTERFLISPENPMSGIAISFVQKYPNPIKRKLSFKVYEERSKEVPFRKKLFENFLVKDLKRFYYDFQFTFIEEKILKEHEEELTLLLKVVEENYKHNRALLSDILMIRAELLNLKVKLEKVYGKRRAYLEKIHSLVGERVSISKEELRLQRFPEDFSPDKSILVRLVKKELKTLRKKLERAKKEHLPDFTFFAEYTFREGMTHLFSLGFGLTLPLRYEHREKFLVLEELEKLKEKEYELEWRKLQVTGIFYSLKERYDALKRSLVILEEEIREKEKEIKALLLAYRYHEVDVREIVRAYRILLDLKLKGASLVKDMNKLVAEAEALL